MTGIARVLVVGSSTDSTRGREMTARLGSSALFASHASRSERDIDRAVIDVALVASDDLLAQRDRVRALKRLPDPLPVLVEVDDADPATVATLLRAGADGVVRTAYSVEVVQRCLAAAARGEVVLPRSAVRHLAGEFRLLEGPLGPSDPRLGRLSDREREVATLLYAGLSTAEVATRLCLAPATVRSHLHKALVKARLRSRDDLFRLLDAV